MSRPAWLYGTGCCDQWTPADGCQWHTGRPAMSLAKREQYDAERAEREREAQAVWHACPDCREPAGFPCLPGCANPSGGRPKHSQFPEVTP